MLRQPTPTPPPSRHSMPAPQPQPHDEPRSSRAILFVGLCFVLGAAIALGWAWKVGRIGGGADVDEERFVTRATDAMFKNHFHEPPGDNVKDITDEGLRRWPNDRKLLDVRVRSANELTSQALAQRSAGDVLEALRLAKVAHDLDPNDPSAKRLVEQYEGELAAFSPSAAPTLVKPPEPPPTSAPSSAKPPPSVQVAHIDYKALLDASTATPRLGQTVEFTARIAPNKGDFNDPAFTIVGPGIPSGVRMPAQAASPGIFKASYAFLEPGKFDVTFSTQEGARPINAKRAITASNPPPLPSPTPSQTPSPTPTGSVKWM
jgi:hypothetical protein